LERFQAKWVPVRVKKTRQNKNLELSGLIRQSRKVLDGDKTMSETLDDKTRTELEAAVYRRLVEHLRNRTDVQNIDLMNLAGFCRNCLSNWMKDAADAKGLPMTKEQSREIVYGEPYDQWRAKHQKEATPEQKAAFQKSSAGH
jgi:hypothetical protein